MMLSWFEPGTVREWATLVGLVCGAIIGVWTVWRQIVSPFIRQRRAELEATWIAFWRIVSWVERETGNGEDPPDLKGKATRAILVTHVVETKPIIEEHHRLVREFEEHKAQHGGSRP